MYRNTSLQGALIEYVAVIAVCPKNDARQAIRILAANFLAGKAERMGRLRHFSRSEVLDKTLPLFWERGFADASLQDIQKATGVNKSGLYSEFKSKAELYLATLRYYGETLEGKELLLAEPVGWANIQEFFKRIQACPGGNRGCFAVNSMRDAALLPHEALEMVAERRRYLKQLFVKNISAEKTKMAAEMLAEILTTFFSGVCIELNSSPPKASMARKIKNFLIALRSM